MGEHIFKNEVLLVMTILLTPVIYFKFFIWITSPVWVLILEFSVADEDNDHTI